MSEFRIKSRKAKEENTKYIILGLIVLRLYKYNSLFLLSILVIVPLQKNQKISKLQKTVNITALTWM